MLTSNITSVAVELCGGSEKLTDTLAGKGGQRLGAQSVVNVF